LPELNSKKLNKYKNLKVSEVQVKSDHAKLALDAAKAKSILA
jgi:hypothetical protein